GGSTRGGLLETSYFSKQARTWKESLLCLCGNIYDACVARKDPQAPLALLARGHVGIIRLRRHKWDTDDHQDRKDTMKQPNVMSLLSTRVPRCAFSSFVCSTITREHNIW
ncbi:unnamed protein product, partial [Ectocarpus sp. 8 AP-2014]